MKMNYYRYNGYTLCSWEPLPYEKIDALPAAGEVIFLFHRPLLTGRQSSLPMDPPPPVTRTVLPVR